MIVKSKFRFTYLLLLLHLLDEDAALLVFTTLVLKPEKQ